MITVCPQCPKKVKGGIGKWIIIAIAILLIISLFGGEGDNEDPVKVGTVGQTDSENTNKETSAEETSAKETNSNIEAEQGKSTVTFEVPIGAEVIEVEYLSNYWTSNRVVFTVE